MSQNSIQISELTHFDPFQTNTLSILAQETILLNFQFILTNVSDIRYKISVNLQTIYKAMVVQDNEAIRQVII